VVSDNKTVVSADETTVYMANYDEEWANGYIATKSPFDKAGGYGIQDKFFEPMLVKIDGELDTVIGLPVKLTEKLLQEINNANGNA
ncbi:MAG: Maf family protein, partial [Clostridia bacterium]|nr:Maf family protein [Clostridia bacterium]